MVAEPVLFPELEGPEFVPSEEIERVAEEVLERHGRGGAKAVGIVGTVREAIADELIRIAYVLNTKPFDPVTEEATHDVVGRCVKAPKLWHDVTGIDVVIWIRADFWNRFDARARAAIVLHELSHVRITFDKEGQLKLKLREHDVEEFIGVVRFYGPIDVSREVFGKALASWGEDRGDPPSEPTPITPLRPRPPSGESDFAERVIDEVVDRVNAGELGPNVTASRGRRRKDADE